jgi:hypothetical protein
MILTKSPYYLTISWMSPSSMTTPDKYIVELYVWSGLKASVPVTATYEIENKNPLGRTGSVDVNISSFLNDNLNVPLNKDTVTNVLSGNSAVWVKSQVIYYIGGVAQSPEFSTTQLAIKGYGYGIEGTNVQPPNILATNNSFLISKLSNYSIPILVSETLSVDVTIISYPLNEINESFTIVATTNSNELVKNIYVKASELTNDTSIVIKRNTDVVAELIIKEELRYTPKDIFFVNRYGQLQSMTLFKEKIDKITIDGNTYETSIGQPKDGVHQFKDYNKNGKTDFTIQSGWLNEDTNQTIKEILLSNDIWMLENDVFIPLNLKTKNITYQTRQKERLINYEFNFEYSFYEINNI